MKEYGKEFCEETWPALFTPIWFDVELHERVHHDPKLIRLVRGEWPFYFLYLCGTEEGDFYVHAKTNHVYVCENGFGPGWLMRDGELVAFQLHRQADPLEEWLERWLDGDMKLLFFKEEDLEGHNHS